MCESDLDHDPDNYCSSCSTCHECIGESDFKNEKDLAAMKKAIKESVTAIEYLAFLIPVTSLLEDGTVEEFINKLKELL